MLCPACSHDQDRVVDSRSTREGAAVRRRRECLACGHRFTTYEYVERIPALVSKKDGRRVPYDRQKLLDGVISACQKRPVSREQIDALADRVEATMHELRAYDREDVWSGRVAARFGDELTDQLRRTRLAAEELRQQAALLRARANLTATGANG